MSTLERTVSVTQDIILHAYVHVYDYGCSIVGNNIELFTGMLSSATTSRDPVSFAALPSSTNAVESLYQQLSRSILIHSRFSGSPQGHQNRHWGLLNACWRLLSRLDRQIGKCTATVFNALLCLAEQQSTPNTAIWVVALSVCESPNWLYGSQGYSQTLQSHHLSRY